MTTNVAECIISCLQFARQLPILTLAEFIRNMLQRWFHDRHHAVQSMRHQLTDATHLMILKRVDKCGYITVNPADWNIFSVKRSDDLHVTTDLATRLTPKGLFRLWNFCSLGFLSSWNPGLMIHREEKPSQWPYLTFLYADRDFLSEEV
ncbi:hypothetical protein Ddye_020683 [Dipteronia dyeriana]|uniref:Uncharacterized protein n=1 Tax=Dipteronia dyeriana TaxID=168575 RepID=A0AAD9U104_9ROSI|nr:hypothetical protein Ddye_020683 [Dipteronia dyeriana]